MKLFAIMALSTVLSHGTAALPAVSFKASLRSFYHAVPSAKALPALTYYGFAA